MFSQKVESYLAEQGKKQYAPSQMVSRWEDFVESCEDGYDWSIYEYDNELSIRDSIELVLKNKDFANYPDYNEFCLIVSKIDDRLKCLFQKAERERKTTWWAKGILSTAGSEYQDAFKSRNDVEFKEFS